MYLPNQLVRYRKSFALTQKEVGQFLGVDASTVSRVEGGAEPTLTFAIGCAYLFGQPLSEFFPTQLEAMRDIAVPALAAFSARVECEPDSPEREQRQGFLDAIVNREDDENYRYAL